MKGLLLILFITFSAIELRAQDVYFKWAKQIGGSLQSFVNNSSIALDATGNVYTTGAFGGTADFDPGPGTFSFNSLDREDIFITKLNAAGDFIWAKHIGGSGPSHANSIALDGLGNIYITGGFSYTVDFDPGAGVYNLTAVGGENIFVLKLDSDGNFNWAKQMKVSVGATTQRGNSITIDITGNVYTTGLFLGTVDFDPGIGTFNLSTISLDWDCFVSKLDEDGNFVWAKQMLGTGLGSGYSITTDKSGNVFTTGQFSGTVDFDPGPGIFNLTGDGNYGFVSKLDAEGNFDWAKKIEESGNDIAIDGSGNVLITGGLENNGKGFIFKFDTFGNSIWEKQIGEICYGVDIDRSGSVFITGRYFGTMDFDPGVGVFNLTSSGEEAIFVSKLDLDGNFVWAKPIGASAVGRSTSIAIDATGNVYTTGYFMGNLDFDPGVDVFSLSALSFDGFVQKMSPYSNYLITDTICNGQNSGGYTSAGTYTDTFIATNGSDSVRTLQLIVQTNPVPYLGADKNICEGSSVVLNPGKFSNYLWQDGSTQNTFLAKQPGEYSVRVTNTCGAALDKVLVKELVCDHFFPSSFTPNNDGKNDLFNFLGAHNISEYHLSIYNRWGETLFETNDFTKGWTGQYKGKFQEPGVYVWVCNFKKSNNSLQQIRKGTVVLIR
jgi:gliding motility-associated-like protein